VPLKAGRTRLRISPSFVPARQGLGTDSRELTLMLLRCELRTAGGSPAVLWELDKA
jgi:hypothetical protein